MTASRVAAAFASEHRHYFLGENVHLLFDLLGVETAEFEPAEEAEVVVAALLAHLHDRVDDVLLGIDSADYDADYARRMPNELY